MTSYSHGSTEKRRGSLSGSSSNSNDNDIKKRLESNSIVRKNTA